jgi:hypothetical protein
MPVIPALKKLRQEDQEFEANNEPHKQIVQLINT